MNEDFIGGFHPALQAPPPPPPKDKFRLPSFGLPFPEPDRLHRSSTLSEVQIPQLPPTPSTPDLTQMSAVERSKMLKTARMNPHLQFMCGPLLRFDNITDNRGMWRGHVMVVSACPAPSFPRQASNLRFQPPTPAPSMSQIHM
jgi:hypothetical protein